ncbi:MAG: alpha/beta hydrolase, partial [Dethiobacteria bacterium]|nr:alpha/beta hydrolase [Dethiobacteria bacterium]
MTDIALNQKSVTISEDIVVNYYSGGNERGHPVILLHGGGTDHALLSWRETIPALLEAGFRVYAPDHPGYGKSLPASRPATVENLVNYLEGFINFLDLKQASLVGLSMGGAIAIGYILNNPQKIDRLVLIGSYGIQDKVACHFLSYLYVKLPWVNNFFWALMRNSRWAARYSINSIVRNPHSRTESLIDEVLDAMKNRASQQAFSQMQQDDILFRGIKTNYTARLNEIEQSVLIIHGTSDIGVPLKYA